MAVVWLARDERLDRDVAVKFLSDALAADPTNRRRFEREARIAAGLTHPNLVNVYDFGSVRERPYLVMEYVEGETLASKLERGRLARPDAERLAAELLGALAAIHAAGVIHRDVKPANVLLDRQGVARLTDFGIAQLTDGTALTEAGQVIGTLRYMAPEVREGKAATARSDLYSCGVVLGECLPAGAGGWVEGLVAQLTNDDPLARPSSAEDAVGIARGDQRGPPPTIAAAGETAPTEPLHRRRTGRRWAAIVGLAAVIAGAALAIALSGGGAGTTTSSKVAAPTNAHKPRVAPPTATVTQTVSTATSPATPAAGASTQQPAVAADPCAQLDAQKKALDAKKHALDQRYKDNPSAKEQAHATLDARQHALDEQKATCKK